MTERTRGESERMAGDGAVAAGRGELVFDVPDDLDRDSFFRALLGDLAETLEGVVGLNEAEGYVAVVGTAMGERILAMYRAGRAAAGPGDGAPGPDADALAAILVDLKRRIGGDFFVEEAGPERIVLGNRACPFGSAVHGRPSLCMMTSNVFGHIAAERQGFAGVEIVRAIARGDAGCRVIVTLDPATAAAPAARRYVRRGRG